MKVKYAGPARDYSGYGEANRHDIAALVAAGCDLTTQIPVYTLEISDYGRLGELASSLENAPLGYRIKIIHTTPNVYKQFFEAGKYHIGRVFWETDKIPLDFAVNVQLLDEIWTGSEFNKRAIEAAGVTKPIIIVPEAIDTDIGEITPYTIPNGQDYRFYSIFEWTERKNPLALLEAFFTEFENTEGVSLTIKTYVDNFTPERRLEIKQAIRKLKAKLNLKKYPPVYLYIGLMDRHQVYRFHKSFDCFVSAHRGEGWGIPQMEALLVGNPIISTGCGGIHEYLDETSAMLLPYQMVPVQNTRNQQWYTPDQKWCEPDMVKAREYMRWAFEHREEAKAMGEVGRQVVVNKFSLKAVGMVMRTRLEEISKEMEPTI